LKVFIDTSAFCALALPKDQNNSQAKDINLKLQGKRPLLYTSDYVLDETFTLLSMRGGHSVAVKFMDQIDGAHINIISVDFEILNAAKTIFRKFDDKRLSFTDCTSFALINIHDLDSVFSFDDHFRRHPYTHPVQYWG